MTPRPRRTVPLRPTGLRVLSYPAPGYVALEWRDRSSGAAVTGYLVRISRPNSATAFEAWQPVSALSISLPGITRGARCVAQVVAVNAIGVSPPASLVFTQAGAPTAVRRIRVRSARAGRTVLTWRPPARGGTVSTYRIRVRRAGAAWRPWQTTPSGTKVYPGLRRGTRYQAQIVAVNAEGRSSAAFVAFRQAA